ncbi:MAG: nucleotidyl transferase AbiEii/AbiGii toxin family protein [bacterium]
MALDIAIHKNILIKILKDIYTDHTLGPLLGFKGGTAAYLFYGLNRFSVDLDFDLLDLTKQDFIFEKIKKVLENYGTIKEAAKKRGRLFFFLSCDGKEPGGWNIKVEINLADFGSKYEVKSYLGISMKVMVKEDMSANKMVALYERESRTNRDIYDVWHFLRNDWLINGETIQRRTGLPCKEFLRKCISLVEKIESRNILAGMGELLDEKQKAWAKAHLKEDVLFQLKLRLENAK